MAKSTSKLFKDDSIKPMSENAMNVPEKVEEMVAEEKIPEEATEVVETPAPSKDDIRDIDLSATARTRFRINGDPNKILELNVSDLRISNRLTESYERLNKYMEEVSKALDAIPDEEESLTDEQENTVNAKLNEIDEKMRQEIDYIFDAPVSDVCADDGSMYDPFNGMFRFEHIIDAITKLYETNLNSEFNLMRRRVANKTSKYTKHYHN